MIPAPGEIYRNEEDGTQIQVTKVEVSKTMELVKVEFVGPSPTQPGAMAEFEANGEGWADLMKVLVKVAPIIPIEPRLPKLRLVEHVTPDLKLLQALGKEFAIGVGDVEMGYIYREPVTVLVARGEFANELREIGLKIHKKLKEHEQDRQDPSLS